MPLATQSLSVVSGLEGATITALGLGHGLHLLTGLVLYPLSYLLVLRPVLEGGLRMPWWAAGAAYGAGLFVFGLHVMAYLVAGLPSFPGWSGITWVALWGHVLFGLIVAGVVRRREGPAPAPRPGPALA